MGASRALRCALALAFSPADALAINRVDSNPRVALDSNSLAPPPPPPANAASGTEFRTRFVLDTGRAAWRPPLDELVRVQSHGEYQLRYTRLTDIPLRPLPDAPATASSLGQENRLYHWLRLTPSVSVNRNLQIVAQLDLPRGLIAGEQTEGVSSSRDSYSEIMPIGIEPRWLYLQWSSKAGIFKIGQQPSHWGMGLVENDGDHPSLFGDYQRGTIVERVQFTTRALGSKVPIRLMVAGDLVYEDRIANLLDEEIAARGVVSVFYEDRHANSIGIFATGRHQKQDARTPGGRRYTGDLTWSVLDSAGRFNAELPGGGGHVFGRYEMAYQVGSSNIFPAATLDNGERREKIRSFGAATELGWVLTAGSGEGRWGQFVSAIEWGWASADADARDGHQRRFTFDPNHNVGLLLFDEVLKWKTARAANRMTASAVPALPSNGGIFGATYLYPTVVVRPTPAWDFKLGIVLAQSTADFVDPGAQLGETASVNYEGAPAAGRDFGVELDGGLEYRHPLDYGIRLQIGAQGGVLLPGAAFDDESGSRLAVQGIGVARLGLQY